MSWNQGRLKNGATLGNYRIIRLIGMGGMGEVYEAKDQVLDRKVALKIILPEHYDSPEVAKRFRIEGQTLAKLNHPNVVTVHALGEDADNHYLVMEYVDGVPLWDLLKAKTYLAPNEAFYYFRQLLAGVKALHESGVIHRDLKPKNIIIRKDNSVKIVDFGIAKDKASSEREITKTGAMVGSLYYLSPEVIEGEAASAQADIWSLGINLFEMLTGRKPFEDASRAALIRKITQDPLIFPADRLVPENIQTLILKMCEKSLDRRYTSIDEILRDFELMEAENTAPIRSATPLPAVSPPPARMLSAEISSPTQRTPFPSNSEVFDYPSIKRTPVWERAVLASVLCLGVGILAFKLREPLASLFSKQANQESSNLVAQSPAPEQNVWLKDQLGFEFSWSGTLPPHSSLQLAKDLEFRELVFTQEDPPSPQTLPPSEITHLEDRGYYWRLVDGDGKTPLTETIHFTVLTQTPQKLLWPLHQSTASAESALLFSWYPKAGCSSYRFQLSRDKDFREMITDQMLADVQWNSKLSLEGDLYWRVRAEDANGFSRWSETRLITLKKTVTAPVMAQTDARNASLSVAPTTPATVPPKPMAATVKEPMRATPPATITKPNQRKLGLKAIMKNSASKKTVHPKAASTKISKKAAPQAPAMASKIAVSAKPTPASAPKRQIAAKSTNLPALSLKQPPDGVSIVAFNGVQNPISFKWESGQPGSLYRLEISTDSGFKRIIHSLTSQKNNLVVELPLPRGKLFWRVRSEKGAILSNWSAPFTLEISK